MVICRFVYICTYLNRLGFHICISVYNKHANTYYRTVYTYLSFYLCRVIELKSKLNSAFEELKSLQEAREKQETMVTISAVERYFFVHLSL